MKIYVYWEFEQETIFGVKNGGPLVNWACVAIISGQGVKVAENMTQHRGGGDNGKV